MATLLPFSVTLPRLALPLLKTTEPVAKPPYWPETVAVSVTAWPTLEGFGPESNFVVVLA